MFGKRRGSSLFLAQLVFEAVAVEVGAERRPSLSKSLNRVEAHAIKGERMSDAVKVRRNEQVNCARARAAQKTI